METTTVELIIKRLKGMGTHIFLPVKVNMQDKMFLLDTGASRTILDGIYYEVNKKGFIDSVIQIGEIEIRYQATPQDIDDVNELYEKIGGLQIAGVLGADLLVEYSAHIMLDDSEIILMHHI